jgi:TolB-like protein
MSDNPNKLSRFWQELKRRNVTRVLAVYIAAAFMILELVSMISEPFGLPDWSFKLALFILIAGFFIALIISWIYDIHPGDGIVKTEPAHKVQAEVKPLASKGWKVATYVSMVIIIGLILINISNLKKVSASLTQYGKSIAVLPFINQTPDEENEHFINGTRDNIINNLQKIKGLRVPTGSSFNQYRATMIPIPEIAEKHRVSFLLQGSMQKYGDKIRIMLQLSDQNDTQIESWQFDEEIKPDQAEKYFALQSEIAQQVAEKLEVVITPEEQQRIEKMPTTSLTANHYFQQGQSIHLDGWYENDYNKIQNAENLYYEALNLDSTYASAYVGLAWVVYKKDAINRKPVRWDSILSLTNIALSYDDELSRAYDLRGLYYDAKYDDDRSYTEYKKALEFNPNNWLAIRGLGHYYRYKGDLAKAIEYYHQALLNDQGPGTRNMLGWLRSVYRLAGFPDKAEYYNQELLKLGRDSSQYYAWLSYYELDRGNWDKMIEYSNKRLAIDSNDRDAQLNLFAAYLLNEEYEQSLKYAEKYINWIDTIGIIKPDNSWLWIGCAYQKNGNPEMAKYYLDQYFEAVNGWLEVRRNQTLLIHRASVYAMRGMKKEALADLRAYNEMPGTNYNYLNNIKNYLFWDNLRDDPEFQKILHDIEAKCLAEHDRVKEWLEENDML